MSNNDKQIILIRILIGLGYLVYIIALATYLLINKILTPAELGIWVGSIGSIAAFIAVIFTTQKQLNEQRESLKKQLKAQKKNLQKQIDNQNKQMHRPYINIEQIENIADIEVYRDIATNLGAIERADGRGETQNGYLTTEPIFLKNEEKASEKKQFGFRSRLKNIGEGIATNIELYDCYADRFVKLHKHIDFKKESTVKNTGYTLNLWKNGEIDIDFLVELSLVDGKGVGSIGESILLYSDIHGNIYMTRLSIRFLRDNSNTKYIEVTSGIWSQESGNFKKACEFFKITEKVLIKKYRKHASIAKY